MYVFQPATLQTDIAGSVAFPLWIALCVLLTGTAQAQDLVRFEPGLAAHEICQLAPAPYQGNHYLRVPERVAPAGKTATATFNITYNGFSQEAEEAFQRAVDTWASLLTSSQDINVSATFASLAPNVLGSAGPNGLAIVSGFSDGIDRQLGRPLLEALLDTDTNPGGADINATFNSDFADWHFGTGPPPVDKVDFESVVLHELGHGLNIIRSAVVDDGDPNNGTECTGTSGDGCMDLDPDPVEVAYGINDSFFIDGNSVLLRDTGTYPDPSATLGSALTGGAGGVFFVGADAAGENGGLPPLLFSPDPFVPGSSLSHLDVSFDNTLNALMTPSIAAGEIVRTPGPVACAMLSDILWTVDQGTCNSLLLPVELTLFEAVADGSALQLFWETASETNNTGFEVQMRETGSAGEEEGRWEVLAFIEGYGTTAEPHAYAYRAEGLMPGRYLFRLKQVDFDGSFEYSPEVQVVLEVQDHYYLSEIYPNPFNLEATVELVVPRRQQVRVEVFDLVGRRVAVLHEGVLDEQERYRFGLEGYDWPSGWYVVQAVGQTFTATRQTLLVK